MGLARTPPHTPAVTTLSPAPTFCTPTTARDGGTRRYALTPIPTLAAKLALSDMPTWPVSTKISIFTHFFSRCDLPLSRPQPSRAVRSRYDRTGEILLHGGRKCVGPGLSSQVAPRAAAAGGGSRPRRWGGAGPARPACRDRWVAPCWIPARQACHGAALAGRDPGPRRFYPACPDCPSCQLHPSSHPIPPVKSGPYTDGSPGKHGPSPTVSHRAGQ